MSRVVRGVVAVCMVWGWGCGPVGDDGGGAGSVDCKSIQDQSECATTEGCRTISGSEFRLDEACLTPITYLFCVRDDSCTGVTGYSVRDSDEVCFLNNSKCDVPDGWTAYGEGENPECNLTLIAGATDCVR